MLRRKNRPAPRYVAERIERFPSLRLGCVKDNFYPNGSPRQEELKYVTTYSNAKRLAKRANRGGFDG